MAMIVCPHCGEQVSEKAKKCVHCGAILIPEEKKHCMECGAELEEGMTECPKCGCPVDDTQGQGADEKPQKVEVVARIESWKREESGWISTESSAIGGPERT